MNEYSKPSTDIGFRTDNYLKTNHDQNVGRQKINEIYMRQPLRIYCKVCEKNIFESPWFKTSGIRYFQCSSSGHLNGEYQDTAQFSKEIYQSEESSYDSNYDSDFDLRVQNIYRPKIEFMLKYLTLDLQVIRLLDFGSGGGHFVRAAQQCGIEVIGLEVNPKLVKSSRQNVGDKAIIQISSIEDFKKILSEFQPNVVSFIGVLEHMTDMDEILNICKTNSIKYLYSSVPVFSLTSILQTLNESVFARQLSGGHTHLFSKNSLALPLNRHSYYINSNWWFGTDFSDLRRILSVSMASHSYKLDEIIDSVLSSFTDKLQSVIDEGEVTSEVHTISELSLKK